MRILVTGGAGFVGSNLASEAIARGYEVVVFDDLSRAGTPANLAWLRTLGPFEFVHGDVRVGTDVERVVASLRPEMVFHLAGQVAMTTSVRDPLRDFDTNARGTVNVLEAVRRHVPEAAVLYSSTNKVYGDLDDLAYDELRSRWVARDYPRGFDESVPFRPTTPYGNSKACADLYMQDYARMYGLRTVVFRHSSIYGGRQLATYDQGWIGWFADRTLDHAAGAQDDVTISGDGKQVRDALHVDDVVRLYFAAAERAAEAAGQVFNIGGGMESSVSILELLDKLGTIVGARLPVRPIEARKSDQRVFVADHARATAAFGWRPAIGVDDGLARTMEGLRQQRAARRG